MLILIKILIVVWENECYLKELFFLLCGWILLLWWLKSIWIVGIKSILLGLNYYLLGE